MRYTYEFDKRPPSSSTRFLFVGNVLPELEPSSLVWLPQGLIPLVESVQFPTTDARGRDTRGNFLFLICHDEAAATLIKDSLIGTSSNTEAGGYLTLKFAQAKRVVRRPFLCLQYLCMHC